ncbi:hypothetical protein BFP78_14355 [Gaetbulibacter sp. 5U11]|nr:hypothetical protein BFP78_14355 [Gaetbulibacter sp. 5U11]
MQNNYRSKAFKAWLDKLQQESWQLELIISGFSIYGLSQAFEPLELYFNISQNESNSYLTTILMIALISCSILLFTLLLHVVLRGLWIGALGLRYVSGDIDYKKLNYRPKFDRYLRKKVGSFDKYIAKLEDYCSILFAVSFLLIFYILSVFIVIGSIVAIAYLFLRNHDSQHFLLFILGIVLLFFILIGMLLTFLDFITQGYLKKSKWLAKIYFPFYWVFSYLTLSFLYRPLVHNFLDNRFGKRLSFTLIPIYFVIMLLASYNYNRSNYFSAVDDSNRFIANANNYDESITEKGVFISDASIPSKIINTNYLPVFIEYQNDIEDIVFEYNPSLKPEQDKRGLKSDIFFTAKQMIAKKNKDSIKAEYIKTLSSIYSFKIDSLDYDNPDFIYAKHNNNQQGFETVLSLKNITEGKHVLTINRLVKKDSAFIKTTLLNIPFWYFKT